MCGIWQQWFLHQHLEVIVSRHHSFYLIVCMQSAVLLQGSAQNGSGNHSCWVWDSSDSSVTGGEVQLCSWRIVSKVIFILQCFKCLQILLPTHEYAHTACVILSSSNWFKELSQPKIVFLLPKGATRKRLLLANNTENSLRNIWSTTGRIFTFWLCEFVYFLVPEMREQSLIACGSPKECLRFQYSAK